MSYYMEDADNTGYLDQGLEISKLVEKEKKAAAGSEFDVLHDKVVAAKKTEELEMTETEEGGEAAPPAETPEPVTDASEEEVASEEEDSTNPFNEDGEGEGSVGGEKPADEASGAKEKDESKDDAASKSEDGDKQEEPAEAKVISESLRHPYDMHYSSVVLEEITKDDVYDGAVKVGGVLYRAGAVAVGLLIEFAKVVVALGVRYGPGVADKLRKGVIYLFTRSVKVLFRTIASSSDFIKRHHHSVSSLKKDVGALRKTMDELKDVELPETMGESFTDEKAIPWFCYGTKVSVAGSGAEVLHFLDATIDPMAKRVLEDIHAVKKMIDMSAISGIRGNVLAMMDVNPIGGEYDRKTLKNYPMDNADVETYVYQRPLPNGVLFITNLPKNKLGDIDKVSAAYKDSSIFMGVDIALMDMPQVIPYLSASELDKYIDQLAVITDLLQRHTEHYVNIANEGRKLKLGYRHYYQKLSSSPEKVGLHESLAEFVFLKQSFASKTYLAGMIDIHDYVTAYVVRATRFAKKNLKVLASVKPSEESPE